MKTLIVYDPCDHVRLRFDWNEWKAGDIAEVIGTRWMIAEFEPLQELKLRGSGKKRAAWFAAVEVESVPVIDTAVDHSHLDRAGAIAEARRIGDQSPGVGWRRLIWRMADLMEHAAHAL